VAWNPAPEVAVARDAAKKLDDAPVVAIFYVTKDGGLGMATYGKTMALCAKAKEFGEYLWQHAETYDPEKGGAK